jgi:hypothetical protein
VVTAVTVGELAHCCLLQVKTFVGGTEPERAAVTGFARVHNLGGTPLPISKNMPKDRRDHLRPADLVAQCGGVHRSHPGLVPKQEELHVGALMLAARAQAMRLLMLSNADMPRAI